MLTTELTSSREEGDSQKISQQLQLYAEVCQIVSSGDIKSVADLKGKRVSVGDAGSGVEFNARQILEAYDISFDDIQSTTSDSVIPQMR